MKRAARFGNSDAGLRRRWRWLMRTLACASLMLASCGGDDTPLASNPNPAGPPLAWDAGSWDSVTWQ